MEEDRTTLRSADIRLALAAASGDRNQPAHTIVVGRMPRTSEGSPRFVGNDGIDPALASGTMKIIYR